ncbi:hypothetical protein SDC9_32096 [bioreactor metagenome]|uniref:Uncharacterized protein n=1 Tax=bioreactor metagenome TaxID=1076179 RepID=A0A644V457_9ZZZZ
MPCAWRAQGVADRRAELGALVGLEPQAENLPRVVRQNGRGDEDRLVADRAVVDLCHCRPGPRPLSADRAGPSDR